MNLEEIKKTMQRERKFRVWYPQINKMVYDIKFQLGLIAQPGAKIDLNDLLKYLSDESIVMDKTNFQDNNGKDIWEGDVCETDLGLRFVVKQSLGCWMVTFGDIEAFLFKILKDRKCTVLGNIFENPELIEQ